MRGITAILGLCLAAATTAQAAGVRDIEIPADARGPKFTAAIWTPCDAPAEDVKLFGQIVRGVRDCPIPGNALPLIVVSHGFGGSALGHRDTTEALADSGFIVVALNHPRDSGLDMSQSDGAPALIERPTDVSRLLDYMLASSPVAARIDPKRIGFFGFSRGGYTGLMLAGAVPAYPLWPPSWLRFSAWAFRHKEDAPSRDDPRFKAFVIADPLTAFPDKDSLRKVTAPVLLWSSSTGGQGVTPERVAAVADDLPARPTFHVVPNSTHLSFIMPCPPAMAKAAGDVCVDPPGFDRTAFHTAFNAEVRDFFRKSFPE